MKGTICVLAQLCFFTIGLSQSAEQKKAENFFREFQYASAATLYEKLLTADTANVNVKQRLAACYHKLNDPKKEEVWLSQICSNESADLMYVKQYGEALAANHKYTEAVVWYNKYLKKANDPEISKLVLAYQQLENFYIDSSFYSVQALPINSQQSDFSPIFFNEGIIFCSARKVKQHAAEYKWNNSSFIDLYFSKGSGAPPVALAKSINSSLHEGPATLSPQSDTLYFTRNNSTGTTKQNDIIRLKIYFSVYKNGSWQKAQAFELNNNRYSTGHPAFSHDHKLYFASDMPGGMGGTDLYWTRFINGHWSKPENLGPDINTSGNELFPYVDASGNLYFSSNRLPGLGGLDVFCARANGQKFTPPVNVGYPINSSKDDFGFIVRDNSGFFSSNRGPDPMDDNLYGFTVNKTKTITIRATAEDGQPLNAFTLQVFIADDLLETHPVAETYSRSVCVDSTYTIRCNKEGYIENAVTLGKSDFIKMQHDNVVTIALKKAAKKISIAVVSSDDKPLPGSSVAIKNLTTGAITTLAADANGKLIVEVNLGDAYEIAASKANYRSASVHLSGPELKKVTDAGSTTLSLPLATTLFEKNDIGQIIELDIKYDVNKFNIRKDAARELDKLVVFLKKNPKVKVELGSHTDSRGSEQANLILSQKRAASAANYIASKGIGSARIIPVGYGKNDLKITDAQSEDDHQQNRRTTVKIVGN